MFFFSPPFFFLRIEGRNLRMWTCFSVYSLIKTKKLAALFPPLKPLGVTVKAPCMYNTHTPLSTWDKWVVNHLWFTAHYSSSGLAVAYNCLLAASCPHGFCVFARAVLKLETQPHCSFMRVYLILLFLGTELKMVCVSWLGHWQLHCIICCE